MYATWSQKYLNRVQKISKLRNLHQIGSWNNNIFSKNIQESLKIHREYDGSIWFIYVAKKFGEIEIVMGWMSLVLHEPGVLQGPVQDSMYTY